MRHLSTTRKPPQPIAKLGNCPPKAEVTSSNLVGRATSVHAIDAKRRRSCASTADKGGWKFRLGAARVEGRPNRIFSGRRSKGPAWRHESDGFYRPVWSAFEAGFACFHVRSVGQHREHGLDARVIEIAKPRERTNLEHIKSAFWSQNIITNMYANDTAYDDMMNLIK